MYHYALMFVVVSINYCAADVYLFLNEEVTVTFSGPLLMLNMENPRLRKWEQFTLCLKSVPSTVEKYCPQGYASFYYWYVGQERIRYRMTRHGTIVDGTSSIIRGSVLFGDDGSVTIKAVHFPPGCYAHLVNAEKVIPTTTTSLQSTITTTETVQTASFTIYYVIGGLALLFVLIVGAVIAFVCWSKKSRSSNDVEGEIKPNVVKAGKSAKPNSPASSKKVSKSINTSHAKTLTTLQRLESHPSCGSEQSERSVLK